MSRPAPVNTGLPRGPIDLRLVVSDLDGTLLDGGGRVPESLWPLLEVLARRGVTFVPASGRQLPTLRRVFGAEAEAMAFIAENGSYVVGVDGREISASPLPTDVVRRLTTTVREMAAAGVGIDMIWCTRDSAYTDRSDLDHLAEVNDFYQQLGVVPDLFGIADEVVKLSIHYPDPDPALLAELARAGHPHQVVRSTPEWVDVMSFGSDKGTALTALQESLGVTPEQTIAFGDYHNDLGLVSATPYFFAMANAHPDVLAAASYVAPSNQDNGVIRVITQLLAGGADAAA